MRILNHRRPLAAAIAVIAAVTAGCAASSAATRPATAPNLDVPVSTCPAPAGGTEQFLPVGAVLSWRFEMRPSTTASCRKTR